MFKLEKAVQAFNTLPAEDADLLKKAVYCMKCGFCRYVWAPNTPSLKYSYQCPSGEHWKFEPYYASGKMEICRQLLMGELDYNDTVMEILYTCTTCGNCKENCNRAVRAAPMDVVQAMRKKAFAAGHVLPSHQKLIEGLKNYGNPWFQPKAARDKWARQMKNSGIKDANKEKCSVLYYVGCTAGIDQSMRKVAMATSRILNAAGIDFGILGSEEICCGSIFRRIGDENSFKDCMQKNIKKFNETGVDTIVTACAGCARTILEDYAEFAGSEGAIKPRVMHVVQFISELIADKKLEVKKEQDLHVTYHDPCHIGRHVGIYEPPREVIRAMAGVKLTEMARNRDFAFCCGAGGGFRTEYLDVALETSVKRVKEAEETGADYILSTCPFCYQNLNLGIQESGSHLQFKDITEVLAEVV